MVANEHIEAAPRWYELLRQRAYIALRSFFGRDKAAIVSQADASGRHAYLDMHYRAFIHGAGFKLHVQKLDYPVSKATPVNAVNYFGVKRRTSFPYNWALKEE